MVVDSPTESLDDLAQHSSAISAANDGPPASWEQRYGEPFPDLRRMSDVEQQEYIENLIQRALRQYRPAGNQPPAEPDVPDVHIVSKEEQTRRDKVMAAWIYNFNRIVSVARYGTENLPFIYRRVCETIGQAGTCIGSEAAFSLQNDIRNLDHPLAIAARWTIKTADDSATGPAELAVYETHSREYQVAMKGGLVQPGAVPPQIHAALSTFISKDKHHKVFSDASSRCLKMARVTVHDSWFGVPLLTFMRFDKHSIRTMPLDAFNLYIKLFTAELPDGVVTLMRDEAWLYEDPEWACNVIPMLNMCLLQLIPSLIALHNRVWEAHHSSMTDAMQRLLPRDAQGNKLLKIDGTNVPGVRFVPLELVDSKYKTNFRAPLEGGGPKVDVCPDGFWISKANNGTSLKRNWVLLRAESLMRFRRDVLCITKVLLSWLKCGKDLDETERRAMGGLRYKEALTKILKTNERSWEVERKAGRRGGLRFHYDRFDRIDGWGDKLTSLWDIISNEHTFDFRLGDPNFWLTYEEHRTIADMAPILGDWAVTAETSESNAKYLKQLQSVCKLVKGPTGFRMLLTTEAGYSRPDGVNLWRTPPPEGMFELLKDRQHGSKADGDEELPLAEGSRAAATGSRRRSDSDALPPARRLRLKK